MKAFIRAALTLICGCFSTACMPTVPAVVGPWPRFYGLVGAYGVRTPQELGQMAANGFHLALLGQNLRESDAIREYQIYVIDPQPEKILYRYCSRELKEKGVCNRAAQDAVLEDTAKYLASHRMEPNVIGYWVLDDFPGGDVRPLLRKMHHLVVEANAKSSFPRAAICGFNAPSSLLNFDQDSCDMVALYIYSRRSPWQVAPIDWSLRQKLSEMLDGLRMRGWEQGRAPLIGMPQAFGNYLGLNYAEPSADDVATQSRAFCQAGAVALLAFTWDDSSKRSGSKLYNTPYLVEGLKQGKRICKEKYWDRHRELEDSRRVNLSK